jgi:hypothetical protein
VVGLEIQDETVEDSRVIDALEMDIGSHDVKKFFGLLLKENVFGISGARCLSGHATHVKTKVGYGAMPAGAARDWMDDMDDVDDMD